MALFVPCGFHLYKQPKRSVMIQHLEIGELTKIFREILRISPSWQGVLCCHHVITASLSPFILTLLKESGGDQIILADFDTPEMCELMNFCYSGN